MATTVVIHPLQGAGFGRRLVAWLRGLVSAKRLLSFVGVQCVVLEGRVFPVRAVPLGVCREMVPALLRCSRRFAEWQIDEDLFDDMVKVLSLGLRTSPAVIEHLSIPLWELSAVIDRIARVNGMPVMEEGAQSGKALAALMRSTGMEFTPPSSVPPAGPGNTSINK